MARCLIESDCLLANETCVFPPVRKAVSTAEEEPWLREQRRIHNMVAWFIGQPVGSQLVWDSVTVLWFSVYFHLHIGLIRVCRHDKLSVCTPTEADAGLCEVFLGDNIVILSDIVAVGYVSQILTVVCFTACWRWQTYATSIPAKGRSARIARSR